MEFGSAAFFRRGLYVCITFIGGVRILVQLDIFHAAGDGRMSDTDELKVVAHLSVDIFRVTASALSAFAELITRRALIAAGIFRLFDFACFIFLLSFILCCRTLTLRGVLPGRFLVIFPKTQLSAFYGLCGSQSTFRIERISHGICNSYRS